LLVVGKPIVVEFWERSIASVVIPIKVLFARVPKQINLHFR
jgi:hypothetical protein